MKIVKIAALAVLVLGIFGVGLWLNVGGGGPTIKPMKPFNNIEEVREGIDDYVANLYSWDKSEYEALKSRIGASIRLISTLQPEAQDSRIDECYKDLEEKTGARIAELLADELQSKSCQYKTASNLGSGLKYFMSLNGDKSDEMISINNKYDAYSSVYWFVQNPMRKMKAPAPALIEYMNEQFENGDVVLKEREEDVKKDWKDQRNLAKSNNLNHITELSKGLSESSIEQKLVHARSDYYESLWKQSQEYYNALNALMGRAIDEVGDRSNNIADVERECKQIFGELNKINEKVGFASNPMSDDVLAIQEVYNGFSAHNNRLNLFSINVGGVEDLIAEDTKFTDAAYMMFSDFNDKLNKELNPKLQGIINAINNR